MPTGGTITTSGIYTIHTFTSSGTFTIDAFTNNPNRTSLLVEYLVVGGGGGGGQGGGGAGGMRTGSLTRSTGNYTVTVGGGGAGGKADNPCTLNAQAGGNSVFDTITSLGGGAGGGVNSSGMTTGGSGGGAGYSAAQLSGAAGTSGQGSAGGNNLANNGYPGGGGGGKGGVGANGAVNQGGNGGVGSASSISGAAVTYCSGGGSGGYSGGAAAGTASAGGGGNGSKSGNGTAGTANTGGGGGGAGALAANTGGNGGSGIVIIRYATSSITPIEITTWAELDAMRNRLYDDFTLMNDLGPSDTGYDTYASSSANGGEGWSPLSPNAYQYRGIFDGQGHTISGLYINRPTIDHQGLFGVTYSCDILNLGLLDVNISGNYSVGSLVGYAFDSTITNCWTSGSVSGASEVGGFVGYNNATISFCHTSCAVTGDDKIGGFVGESGYGLITDCYSTGNVIENQDYRDGIGIGGFVGRLNSSGVVLTNCYSTGLVDSGDEGETTGGFCGENAVVGGSIVGSFWNTETSGLATSDGGVGKTTAQMKDIDLYTTQTYFPPTDPIEQLTDTNHITPISGGVAGSGELSQQKAQSFVATGSVITGVGLRVNKMGTVTDNIIVTITSSLGGASLGSKSLAASSFTSGTEVEFIFDTPINVTSTNTYYIQVSRSGARDETNQCRLYMAYTTNPYAGGSTWKRDNNSWAADSATTDLYFLVIHGDSTGDIGGIETPWDIVALDSYVDETWKIEDGITYPRLGFETVVLPSNTGAFFAFL